MANEVVAQSTRGTELEARALKLPEVLMQGVTHIAPAVGMVLTIQFITSLAGITSPLAYLLAFLITLTLGISLTQLAKHLPSAGGYYTYLSRTVHPRAGFLTAWLFFLYDPTGAAINLAFMGFFFESTMKAEYNITFRWWWFFLLGTAFITFLVYRGIKISARGTVILGVIEVSIVVILALFGLLSPGEGGIGLGSYNPGNTPSASGLYLAVIYSIIAVSIACTNAATRVFFAMGRSGSLPRSLAVVHPRFKTPRNAVVMQTILTLVIGLGLGFLLGPDQEFFMMGVAITLGLVLVYSAGNIGVYRYYRAERAQEFNPWLHLVFPLFSTVALLFVGYKSIVPLPAYPVVIAPFLVVVWLVAGVILVYGLSRTGREEWLMQAARVYEEA